VLSYSFKSKNKLSLAEGNGAPVESGYGALTLKQAVFFSHMVPRTRRGYNVAVDLKNNLATVFEVWFSGGKTAAAWFWTTGKFSARSITGTWRFRAKRRRNRAMASQTELRAKDSTGCRTQGSRRWNSILRWCHRRSLN